MKRVVGLVGVTLLFGCGDVGTVLWTMGVALLLVDDVKAESRLYDEADEFTDERDLMVVLPAKNDGILDGTLAFRCDKRGQRLMAAIKPGFIFHVSDKVDVKLRFDDKPFRTMSFVWIWNADGAVRPDGAVLLENALASERLIAKVEDSDTLRFDLLAARKDLVEFKRRCDAWRGSSK